MRPTSVQQHYVQMTYTKLHQTQSINVESTDINSFMPSIIYTFLCTDLYESHKCLMTSGGVLLYRIVSKLEEKYTKHAQSLKAKNALVNSVYCVTRCTILCTVSQDAPFCVLCHKMHHSVYCVTRCTIYNLVFSIHLFNITANKYG